MGKDCCEETCSVEQLSDERYRRILWIALVVNLAMFIVEIITGWYASSTSLLADAMDFLGDAGNYGASLFALTLPIIWRSRVALGKGLVMGSYGLVIIVLASAGIFQERVPLASIMGIVALLALITNISIAFLLYRFRKGDSNMRSVWLCSRNDAIANIAVMLAALGVWLTQQRWPDLVVAIGIGLLGVTSAYSVIRYALSEMHVAKQSKL